MTTKNALILHGAGNTSQGNWFPWLKKELEKKGYVVWSPDLPNSDVPKQDDWLHTIFSNTQWQFNEESVIIGHSAGAAVILRILEQLPDGVSINKAVLVAGPVELGTKSEYFPYKQSLVENPFNQCGVDQGKIMQHYLGGELIVKPNQGHFNLEKGPEYKQFSFILELLEK
ncbi:MAG: hypothetical protein UY27_C0007G0029 [Candidatus Gottesmanbacteria bacterium GW2011_GWA1_48_13]|uniref:Serine hydrolase family protein n=1 Tax=Candidatus Gottesmanbacteria bacterium GW2011_GWA1_48_13 TaxID=1618439 RepID=A0A0G1UP48_9BACT|nr:MAG: hypothetical protein UY27_C0007G0029 [Candidatus Gottesmanbacteria bacterium GW2011_GWA1_48_13]